jgi:prepilin-type N-terminal cleavage/methylation domain-containing protein/prepilin-type processing-associated H-X9-DG protein
VRMALSRGDEARSGFTLLELMVVVSLIAILAGLLFPAFANARSQAQRTACLGNLHQIGLAHQLYVEDWDERFPHWWQAGLSPDGQVTPAIYWTEFLHPYLRSDAVLHDPSAVRSRRPEAGTLLAGYSLLTWRQSGRRDDPSEPRMQWPGPPLTVGSVAHPSETLAVMDGWTTTQTTAADTRRHGKGVNAACVDGHARWLTDAELWRLDRDDQGMYWLHYGSAGR